MIFVGAQASGKSTFYVRRFFETHVRVNLDMLRTRRREELLVGACLDGKQAFVVDNTNATVEARARYIGLAKEAGFRVVGYYFESRMGDCLRRNNSREGKARVPAQAIGGTIKRLQAPSLGEGFDELWYVRIGEDGEFVVEGWKDEV
ncbi:MAG: AAA family ATPase [Chloroflexia bacterium]